MDVEPASALALMERVSQLQVVAEVNASALMERVSQLKVVAEVNVSVLMERVSQLKVVAEVNVSAPTKEPVLRLEPAVLAKPRAVMKSLFKMSFKKPILTFLGGCFRQTSFAKLLLTTTWFQAPSLLKVTLAMGLTQSL